MEEINYKVVLLGDAGVGKTYIMNQYVRGSQPRNNLPTIGIEFAAKTVTLQDGGKIQAQIWDTAGQERYRAITNNHFRKAGGALLVYDITKEKTFENLQGWLENLRQVADSNVVVYIVGNKLDLVERQPNLRKVSNEEGMKFAKENKCYFQEASAYKNLNIGTCFEQLIQEMYMRKNLCITDNNEKLQTEVETPMCSKCCQ